ncbi:glycosyltransferase family 1 protein [Pedobacter chinensis]|uniref:Glycosyltransferase family 1 protein n=1 Tax=Pedobacter chinensis TaxID=2282421 RepID=A0A369PV95_9SPHI|nr:glycosyltransferase [Pedobacter chinensis]RDC56190.1 glycosyltransferase family 1 protein [Pedobacter chinensis]
MPIIENRDIVVVGQQPWDTPIGSNCKDLAMEFSKHNRVLYINSPLDRRTKFQQRDTESVKKRIRVLEGEQDGLEEIAPNLWAYYPDVVLESINFIKWTPIFRWLNKVNNKRFAISIKKAISRLDFQNIILFNDSDMFRSYHLKELLNPRISVYYSRDNMIATPYWGHHGRHLEPELIKKSDLCVANSIYLANYCKKYNPNSFYVGQGCDFELFKNDDSVQIPEDVADIQRPILGFVGALLSIRLDENILLHLAEQRPDWSIVLVGPEDDEFRASKLHQLKNVYFLGAKKPATLAAYIKGFDVCLNPQALNPLTIGNYPRKIDEYLAMGKPVLATKTEAIGIFKDYIYIAETREDYVTLAEKALTGYNEALANKRIAFAQTHTWEKNVEEIYRAIAQIEKT